MYGIRQFVLELGGSLLLNLAGNLRVDGVGNALASIVLHVVGSCVIGRGVIVDLEM